jgi:hypothetical protein
VSRDRAAVDPAGAGDVTKTHFKWRLTRVPEGYSSPVVSGEYLYRLHAPETVTCLKLATGEVMFRDRLPGLSTASSPVATPDGRAYLARAGKTYVLRAGPMLDLLATNDLGDPGPASAAVADGRLYLKGRKWRFCVGRKG